MKLPVLEEFSYIYPPSTLITTGGRVLYFHSVSHSCGSVRLSPKMV